MATVWVLPYVVAGFTFEVRNHQWDFAGDLEAGSGPLNEFRRGIIISVAKTIFKNIRATNV